MKILYLAERFSPFVGGIETMSEHLLSALSAAGHEVQIVTSQCEVPLKEYDEWQGMPLFRLPMLTSLARQDIRGILQTRAQLRRIKREFQPDITHIQFSGPSSMFHWDTMDASNAPTLITVHSVAANVVKKRSLYLDAVQRADWVAPVSRHMLDWTLQHAPGIAAKSSVVYNGIPSADLPENPGKPPFDPPTILWIGRMVDWKRVDRLIEAVARLAPSYPDLRLCLAGDGPERQKLEGLAKASGIAAHTRFTGWVDGQERSKLMRQATLVAIPSEAMENLPMVALEAAGHGRPIVGSQVSGLPEIVSHDSSGLLLADPSPESLAEAIGSLLNDPKRAEDMGRKAAQTVRERFTCDRMVHGYLDLYTRLTASGAS